VKITDKELAIEESDYTSDEQAFDKKISTSIREAYETGRGNDKDDDMGDDWDPKLNPSQINSSTGA
jgi:hypothetical protein